MLEEDEDAYHRQYADDGLRECLALTPIPMPNPKQPSIELKLLPKNLRYEFLDERIDRLILVNVDLNDEESKRLLMVLRKYPTTLGDNISDLKGISPFVCMPIIMLEEDSKSSREHQRRINPIMSDVVRREVLKFLEVGIIYPISDS